MAYVPLLHHALSRARMLERRPPARYRRDPIGWLLWATMGPPVRVRLKTITRFLPSSLAAPALLVQEFDRLQAAQLDCLAQADGLPLARVRVTSPFNAHVRYNLFACFTILPRHQHRHLWQAERGWAGGGWTRRVPRRRAPGNPPWATSPWTPPGAPGRRLWGGTRTPFHPR